MLTNAIYSLLSSVNANTYPGVTEQEVDPPFIVHSVARTIPHATKDGVSTMDVVIYKIASYATLQTGAQTQADAVRAAIDEYSGVISSTDIDNIRFVDEESGYDQGSDLYYVLQTYRIWVNFNT